MTAGPSGSVREGRLPIVPAPFVLEVVGPSGAGKSSVVRAIVGDGGGEYESGRVGNEVGYLDVARSAVRAALAFAPQVWRVPSRPWYRFHIAVQLQSHAQMLRNRRGSGGVLVMDQGPVYLLSILQRALRSDGRDSPRFLRYWEETLASWARSLHLVVMLDAKDELLYERVVRRGTPHNLLRKSVPAARRSLGAARRSRDAIVNALRDRNPSLAILHLPVDELSAPELARRIRSEVDELTEAPLSDPARRPGRRTGDRAGQEP